MPVIAASTSGNCFDYAFMAGKIALEHMTPVVLLTDGFLANGAQPWLIPSMAKLPEIKLRLAKEGDDYKPYARDPETLARTPDRRTGKDEYHRNNQLCARESSGHDRSA